MARKQQASDEQILQAALRVIVRRGHDGFTLADVAREVGLSRAAIILRFKGTAPLKVTLTAYIVGLFEQSLGSLPAVRSGDGLIDLVTYIGGMISTPGSLSAFMRSFRDHLEDTQLAQLELRRSGALESAVAARMPATGISHESAVVAFVAHVGGSLLKWEVQSDTDARSYLIERTKEWLALAHIEHGHGIAGARLAVLPYAAWTA